MTGVGVVELNVGYIVNKKQKKRSTGTNKWAIKSVRNSVTLNPWPPERKRREMSQEGEDLSAAKPERDRLRGTLWGRYNQARRKGVKRERPVR